MLIEATLAALSGAGMAIATGLALRAGSRERLEASTIDRVLPFAGWADDHTALTKEGAPVRVLQIAGQSLARLSREEQQRAAAKTATVLSSLLSSGALVRFIGARVPISIEEEVSFPSPVLNEIHAVWNEQFAASFVTRRYIVMSWPPGTALGVVAEATKDAIDGLRQIKPLLLGQRALVEFFGDRFDTIHGGIQTDGGPSDAMHVGRLRFTAGGVVEVEAGGRSVFSRVVSVVRWGELDSSEVIDGLLALRGQIDVVQVIKGYGNLIAQKKLAGKKRQIALSGNNAVVDAEFKGFVETIQSGDDTYISTHLYVVVSAPDPEKLDALASDVVAHLSSMEHKPRRETRAAGYLWLHRLPGGYPEKMIRPRDMAAANAGRLWRWEHEVEGGRSNDWGPGAPRILKSATGSAVRLQCHLTEKKLAPGHFVILGGTGGGKTVLAQHLIGGFMRYPGMLGIAWDRYLGMEVFADAVGAGYVDPTGGAERFNPLALPGTSADRAFLKRFLLQLAGVDTADPAHIDSVERGIDRLMAVEASKRRLSDVLQTSFDDGAVKAGLRPWATDNGLRSVFNGHRDSLRVGPGLTFFDMTLMSDDPEVAAGFASYLMYQVRRWAGAGHPHFFMLDEILPLLPVKAFASMLLVLLREHRKLRGIIGLVVQELAALLATEVGGAALSACKTRFFLHNDEMTPDEAREAGLSSEDYDFVRGDHALRRRVSHAVLIKRGPESTYADLDMRPLGPLFRLYEGGPVTSHRKRILKERHGSGWVQRFVHTDECLNIGDVE